MSGPDVLTFGESMVSFRSEGPLAQGVQQVTRVAGAESNVAIGLARLGHTVAWAGRVGADGFGALILRELRAEGVDTTHAVVDAERPTGLMFVEQRTADLARVDYRRTGSAGAAVHPGDIAAALGTGPRILHLTGITGALSDSARDTVQWVAGAARTAGAQVSLDVNFRARLWSREQARAMLRPLARHAAYVIAGDDELDLVADGNEEQGAAQLLGAGARAVVVKRGALGATLHTSDGRVDLPALAVTGVDTIGAGDAFCAGFLSGVLDGLEPAACLRRGIVTGAYAASVRGDWEGAPRRDELAALDQQTSGVTLR